MGNHVAAYLRDLIMSGQFAKGERLRLKPLAATLGVSTTPVREALLLLQSEGLVEGELHRGFQVRQLSAEDILDIFELHAVIAGKLAERAALRCRDSTLSALRAIDTCIHDAAVAGDPIEVEEQNFQFHRTINRSADSPMLTRFLLQTTRYVPRHFYARIPGWVEASSTEHAPILAALAAHQGKQCRELTEQHIRSAGVLLVAYLRSIGVLDEQSELTA